MKNLTIKISSVLTIALVLVLLLSSCDKDWLDLGKPGKGGGGKPPVVLNECTVTGTMTRVQCGSSIYDNLLILTDDGKYLQPCNQSFETLVAYSFKDGDRVMFGYSKLTGPSLCGASCAAGPTGEPVTIDCIKLIEDDNRGECSLEATVVSFTCATSIYNDYWFQTDDGQLFQPCDQSFATLVPIELNVGDRVRFGYHKLIGKSPCDEKIACTAVVPDATKIVVDCLYPLNNNPSDCKPIRVIEHPELTLIKPADGVSVIRDLRVEGDCLKFTMGFSGCSADADRFDIVWTPSIDHEGAGLYLIDNAPQMCQAFFSKEVSYNISDIRKRGYHSATLLVNGQSYVIQL